MGTAARTKGRTIIQVTMDKRAILTRIKRLPEKDALKEVNSLHLFYSAKATCHHKIPLQWIRGNWGIGVE